MSDESVTEENEARSTTEVDPALLEPVIQGLRAEQNLLVGLVAGLAASAVGAGVWAAVTVVTGYQIGFMAIGVGFLVGLAVRIGGKGIDSIFGIVGAGLALLGCAAGNLLAVSSMISTQESLPLMEVLSSLDPGIIQELMVATFSPMDLLFYGIAVYEGYQLSFRQLGEKELSSLTTGQ